VPTITSRPLPERFHGKDPAQLTNRRQFRQQALPVVKGMKGVPGSRAADRDMIPVLTDDMAAVPVLTEVIPEVPAHQKEQPDRNRPGSKSLRTRAERDVRDRIAEQEARLEQTMAQLERVKAQAASVRDALAAEQHNRHMLEQRVSDLLTRHHGVTAAAAGAASGETVRPVPGGHLSRREMARQLAELSDYVACRKRWWEEMESLAESNRQRIRELEQEVAQRLQREAVAREVADREQARAAELQDQLISTTREVEQLRRELADSRLQRREPAPEGPNEETGDSS
jgi:hypothetical protein